jgi:exodeoxyribonuclease VII small subunit
MADDKYTFEQARVRLEEIVTQVRRKDVSLEASIDLLEEGVRLANTCTELSDHTEWRAVLGDPEAADDAAPLGEAEEAGEGVDAAPVPPGEPSQTDQADPGTEAPE